MELRERLRLALGTEVGPSAAAGLPAAGPGPVAPSARRVARRVPAGLPVRPVETDGGLVYQAEEWWPQDHSHGRIPLRDALSLNEAAMSRLASGLDAIDLAGAAFLDVETTGLAGGTGTYVFLVGLGTFEDGAFRLRQFFLADLRGEAAMLTAVAEALSGCRAFVSFNGRCFDLPLLETRLALSRLPRSVLSRPHLDLLYPARRLYKRRLASCRLACLEEALLGVEREDDVPGWAIPALYFDYVRTGRAGPLRAVFRHNALDILSLAALLGHLGHVTGSVPPSDPGDCLAMARWDESEGRLAEAARLYEVALDGGADGEGRALSLRRLARLYRRLERWDDAARLWRQRADGGRPSGQRLEALIELAKLEEHHHRDYASAEALTRDALSLVEIVGLREGGSAQTTLTREALEHRLWRLRRRLAAGRGRPWPAADVRSGPLLGG